jgi:hypothetical protein
MSCFEKPPESNTERVELSIPGASHGGNSLLVSKREKEDHPTSQSWPVARRGGHSGGLAAEVSSAGGSPAGETAGGWESLDG